MQVVIGMSRIDSYRCVTHLAVDKEEGENMSYHDRRLLESRSKAREAKAKARLKVLNGAFSLTLFPHSPRIKIGSIGDDWKAVGKDIQKAMDTFDSCK